MEDKISIILPIFNVGDHLRGGIDSLINQTIGNENLEIIMVNDCSTDGSGEIIDEYAEKYDCCIAIHHEKNSGAAFTPRNTGIDACTGDYIMFLDPDDRYTPDSCETLYNAVKENDADMAFARFRRIFEYGGNVQKSYSPYEDDLEHAYPDETFETPNFLNVSDFVWDNFMCYDYYIRDLPDDKSITNTVNVRLLDDLMESYIYCRKLTEGYSKEIQTVSVNPHLLHWMNTWKGSPFTKDENRLLLKKVNKLKKIHQTDTKTKMLLSAMTTAIETSIFTSKA